ncbi:MAG: 30S ribosomal protein S4, partial [Oscillospiraceae bacterium]
MAVNRDPILKKCRSLDISPMVLGYSENKKSMRFQKDGNRHKKVSEYGQQLKEKQKLKFVYGVLEKQFYHYYELASKEEGIA